MSRRSSRIVLGVLLVAVFAVVLLPRLGGTGRDGQFAATSDPQAALAAAVDAGQPAFLEFYGSG